MPPNPPLTASGPRDPEKRPRPLPTAVRRMIELMVRGREDDADGKPLDFIEAGAIAGFKPDTARRWIDRSAFRTALRAERRAFREAICAGNEASLKRVRDTSANGMCVVASIRALEQIDADDREKRNGPAPWKPGLLIVVHPAAPPPTSPQPVTIEGELIDQPVSAG